MRKVQTMTVPRIVLTSGDEAINTTLYRMWMALRKFLGIPLAMLLGSVALSIALYALDRNTPGWLQPVRSGLGRHIFTTPDTTGAFLGIVAGGMFTQTSIVVTMLLLILQQTASVMGNFIYNQFLRRQRNQIFAGYVVGSLLVALTLRTTVTDDFNPILGATGTLVIIVISMGLLIWFLHSTIQQMRPEIIVETIHDETDHARHRERAFLSRVRSEPRENRPPDVILRSETHGFLVQIDLDAIEDCLPEALDPSVEVILQVELGDYVTYYQTLAHVTAGSVEEAEQLARCVGDGLRFDRERNMDQDPAYGIGQLEAIGWTEISTAKDNPETGLMVLNALRNLMSRWIMEEESEAGDGSEELPVVYERDTRYDVIDAWESLITVSSESMQHQAFAEVLDSLVSLYPQIPVSLRGRVDMLLLRAVSGMGDHVLTQDLDSAASDLIGVLRDAGRFETAMVLQEARDELAASLGTLANRSTRVKQEEKG